MVKTKHDETTDLVSLELNLTTLMFRLVGTTPLIMNRMSEKARQELLYPSPKKNSAERASTMKHNPPEEYRSSIYRCREADAPTLVHMPTGSFKKALSAAAIDLPGAFKAQVGRLTSIADTTVHIYGMPMLFTTIVRQAGMNKTPDVRTRAIFPRWCCELSISHVSTLIPAPSVEKLLISAGMFVGVGDYRPEKGAGNYGSWRVVSDVDDPEFADLVANEGREAQQAAFDKPDYYDDDTAELIEWFAAEHIRRKEPRSTSGEIVAARKANGKSKQTEIGAN